MEERYGSGKRRSMSGWSRSQKSERQRRFRGPAKQLTRSELNAAVAVFLDGGIITKLPPEPTYDILTANVQTISDPGVTPPRALETDDRVPGERDAPESYDNHHPFVPEHWDEQIRNWDGQDERYKREWKEREERQRARQMACERAEAQKTTGLMV